MEQSIVFSPSDLIEVLNQTLDYAYPSVEIEGEVASFKINQNKYVFFDLKDEAASVNCFMSLYYLRQPLEDGMTVRVHARLQITKWGKFSLVVDRVMPVGEGSIKQAQEILRKKLTKEGLFDVARKRSLPYLPSSIGVISSEQAAGYADFVRILDERWGGLEIFFRHTQVQGDLAADQIIKAINQFNQMSNAPELIAIIRGGGSADDLACFNDERLVRAIVASRIPIITGIGHETDQSLSDLAADVIAATPSHAAQMIVPNRVDFIDLAREKVMSVKSIIINRLDGQKRLASDLVVDITKSFEHQLYVFREKIMSFERLLESYNPERVLKRGYAIMQGLPKIGEEIKVETKKYFITAEVKDVQEK
ncbi:MAG: exodeoxyribonuclease VII large subunit [Candidatus Nanosyncoccaceae bacterium]|jgi:exodeoxyribonuclease VII large subunit